ncbi:MAG: prepilin-type N-terminal cleavage/methylation domain-containing protein [Planctomycetota bacterium]|nr:prepilin-type N-terminal cleavage/methylation domain-containing protein [Planctomycetota bacterium]
MSCTTERSSSGGWRSGRRSGGFTLVEAMVAITLIALAGSALLLATQTSMDSSEYAFEQNLARGIANQMIDEVLGRRYGAAGVSPYQYPLIPGSHEISSPQRRILFDDTDDFNRYSSRPLRDPWAIELGQGDGAGGSRHPNFQLRDNYFDDWAVAVRVCYVDAKDLSKNLTGSKTSGYRAVEVTVKRYDENGSTRQLVTVRRVYGYVPTIN